MISISSSKDNNNQVPQQVYTLASAMRNKSRTTSPVYSPLINFDEMREMMHLNQERKQDIISPYQSVTRLPMNMIVSKMATRKKVMENEDLAEKIDISKLRSHKLNSPWRTRYNSVKRLKPSSLEKMVNKMKAICTQYDSNLEQKRCTSSNQGRNQNLKSLVPSLNKHCCANLNFKDSNYHQLYCKSHIPSNPTPSLEEDPLHFNTSESPKASCKTKPREDFQFNPVIHTSESNHDFVWNPVILPCSTNSLFFSTEASETTPAHDERYMYSSTDPLHQYHNPSKELSTYNNSPCGQNYWETSSSSSGQTIAEEKLQFTFYSKLHGKPKYNFKTDTFQRPHSHNGLTHSQAFTSPSDHVPHFFKFLEE